MSLCHVSFQRDELFDGKNNEYETTESDYIAVYSNRTWSDNYLKLNSKFSNHLAKDQRINHPMCILLRMVDRDWYKVSNGSVKNYDCNKNMINNNRGYNNSYPRQQQ